MCSCCKCCSCKCNDTVYPPPQQQPANSPAATKNLDLARWKLTLPDSKEVSNLKESIPPFFIVEETEITFKCKAGSGSTKNSKYSRCELRELNNDKSLASWSILKDKRCMTFTFKVTEKPKNRPRMSVGQIHDSEDDVIMLCVDLDKNFYEITHNSIHYGQIVEKFEMDKWYVVTITAGNGKIVVECEKKIEIVSKATGCYFKIGNYLQSSFPEDESTVVVSNISLY